jgi:hypothetical protein
VQAALVARVHLLQLLVLQLIMLAVAVAEGLLPEQVLQVPEVAGPVEVRQVLLVLQIKAVGEAQAVLIIKAGRVAQE